MLTSPLIWVVLLGVLATVLLKLLRPRIEQILQDQDLKDQAQAVLDQLQNQPAAGPTSGEPKAELSARPTTAADMTVEVPAVTVGTPTEIASAEQLIAKLDPVKLAPETD
jgi:type II secretory pathway pseudopilin PulG